MQWRSDVARERGASKVDTPVVIGDVVAFGAHCVRSPERSVCSWGRHPDQILVQVSEA